ncbi:MAG: serpin family protein [Desulfobacteraceae bacterium]|nr:serpin family protein [Desulfobacteraceae bacterium]
MIFREGDVNGYATAVIMGETAIPPSSKSFTVDRPFIFFIRDIQTGTILFAGRIVNPVE